MTTLPIPVGTSGTLTLKLRSSVDVMLYTGVSEVSFEHQWVHITTDAGTGSIVTTYPAGLVEYLVQS